MLRHVVMFKLKDGAPADALTSLEAGLQVLPQSISEISSYRYGSDLGLREGNFDFCLVAEFEDAGAFARYVVHPDHQAFIKDRLTPVVSERVSVQYAI
jgi:hypothetical protein